MCKIFYRQNYVHTDFQQKAIAPDRCNGFKLQAVQIQFSECQNTPDVSSPVLVVTQTVQIS